MIKPNFEFQERFGKIFGLIPDGQLVYESWKGKLYSIPENISEEELENLMRLSVEQNKTICCANLLQKRGFSCKME